MSTACYLTAIRHAEYPLFVFPVIVSQQAHSFHFRRCVNRYRYSLISFYSVPNYNLNTLVLSYIDVARGIHFSICYLRIGLPAEVYFSNHSFYVAIYYSGVCSAVLTLQGSECLFTFFFLLCRITVYCFA